MTSKARLEKRTAFLYPRHPVVPRFQTHRPRPPDLPMIPARWLNAAAMPPAHPSQSAEDYLERIHELIEDKGYARVVDIASSLKVRQASVTSMVQKLGELGFLKYEKYRGLILTDQGRDVARRIKRRHETLARFFSLLGLKEETQRKDIEGMEHHLSPETLATFSDLTRYFEDNPKALDKFLQSREKKAGR